MRRVVSAVLILTLIAGPMAVLVSAPPVAAAGQVYTYMTGLDWPIALAFSPDGRIFFAERLTGNIRIIKGGAILAIPFYTLPNTNTAGERGLLGLALDPDFPATPWVYAYQTFNDVPNGTVYNRIVRIMASGDTGVAMEVILAMPPLSGATNHNGGVIAFGPDRKLYAVVGENANPALSQNPMSVLGKVLRLNPDGTAPADNPFYGSLTWDNRIFTYGHRNMFGLAFHPFTNRVYVTENGPNCNDEINLLTAGRNYGWGPSATCASPPAPPANTNQDGANPVLPIWWWGGTICPTNAAIYGGPYLPSEQGDLFMGDCNFSRLHRLHLVPPNYDTVASDSIVWTAPSLVLEVENGPDGAIWFTTPSTIYRYTDANRPPIASFTATPNPATTGATVTFDASASYDPDGTIVSYSWDFGDTTTGTGVVVTHAYATSGTYAATLTVLDNESLPGRATTPITVNGPPRAVIAYSPTAIYASTVVTFDGSGSTDDGPIISYAWDFGDGNSGTGVQATHAYARKGGYTVALTVTDNFGLSNETTTALTVRNSPPRITSSNPGLGPVFVAVNATRTFTVTAWDPDGDVLSYAWTVDGVAAGGNTTGFDFSRGAPGTYVVNVTVSDGDRADWREWTVTVTGPGGGAAPVFPWWILAVVIIVAVLGAIFLLWWPRRRRKAEASLAPPPPPP